MHRMFKTLPITLACLLSAMSATAEVNVAELLKPLQAVGPKGAGQTEAAAAWKALAQASPEQLPEILAGMDGQSDLAVNWIRSVADAVGSRAKDGGESIPVKALEAFLADTRHHPAARVTAYEWIAEADESAKSRLIPNKLDDPSMELRYQAVEMSIDRAKALLKDEKKDEARLVFSRAFRASRNLKQAESLADSLEELGERPSLSTHFGFVMRWKLVAPFDNVDKKGFDIPYAPEANPKLAAYAGKEGEVKWIDHTTEDSLGLVDLNKAIGRHKGAICYAFSEFVAAEARDCEIRIGCINANKVWLNGELVTANHVYHSGRGMDQYQGRGRLRKGANQILVKIAQNEQTEQWAQDWQFQLRVCDDLGTGLLSTDRPKFKAALAPIRASKSLVQK